MNISKDIKSKEDDLWMPLSDLMSALMIIFLFISIAYMYNAKMFLSDNTEKAVKSVDSIKKINKNYLKKELDLAIF
jgi:hypothetical protein